jgi:hypothetical protein
MTSIQSFALQLRAAIVVRMQVEEAESLDDAEIVRTLAPCCGGRRLIEAAKWLRDAGRLSVGELTPSPH